MEHLYHTRMELPIAHIYGFTGELLTGMDVDGWQLNSDYLATRWPIVRALVGQLKHEFNTLVVEMALWDMEQGIKQFVVANAENDQAKILEQMMLWDWKMEYKQFIVEMDENDQTKLLEEMKEKFNKFVDYDDPKNGGETIQEKILEHFHTKLKQLEIDEANSFLSIKPFKKALKKLASLGEEINSAAGGNNNKMLKEIQQILLVLSAESAIDLLRMKELNARVAMMVVKVDDTHSYINVYEYIRFGTKLNWYSEHIAKKVMLITTEANAIMNQLIFVYEEAKLKINNIQMKISEELDIYKLKAFGEMLELQDELNKIGTKMPPENIIWQIGLYRKNDANQIQCGKCNKIIKSTAKAITHLQTKHKKSKYAVKFDEKTKHLGNANNAHSLSEASQKEAQQITMQHTMELERIISQSGKVYEQLDAAFSRNNMPRKIIKQHQESCKHGLSPVFEKFETGTSPKLEEVKLALKQTYLDIKYIEKIVSDEIFMVKKLYIMPENLLKNGVKKGGGGGGQTKRKQKVSASF
ncbi:hypothetical protein niasHS_013753 [Heterodera schachtii]|uniref:C2H2-type domain-containing protein n=1 Tax=Heterodera schachtii TaxID=97005 RepID=A0ABD2IKC5_HETSC